MPRLRQVVLVVDDVDDAAAELSAVFGVPEVFREETTLGLEMRNAVLLFGDTFVEVCRGDSPGSPVDRFLARNGEGGYMLLLQVPDLEPVLDRARALSVRSIWEYETSEHRERHLHPKDIAGPLTAVSMPARREDWRWAGPGWRAAPPGGVIGVSGAEIATADPDALVARWSELFGLAFADVGGERVAEVGDRLLHVVPTAAGPPRITGIDVVVADPEVVLARARVHGAAIGDDELELRGMRFRLR